MKPFLLFTTLLLACGLAWQTWQSSKENERLDALLLAAEARGNALQGNLSVARKVSVDLEARVQAEHQRREALALAEDRWSKSIVEFLEQLKNQRAAVPVPSRKRDAPRGTYLYTNGVKAFPELMGNAEYSALVRQRVRGQAANSERFLALDLAPDIRAKALELMVDQSLLSTEYLAVQLEAGVAKPETRSPALLKEQERLQSELRTLLGEQALAAIEPPAQTEDSTSWRVTPIATRLSYSEQPLQPTQLKQLSALMQAQVAEASRLKKPLYWGYANPRDGFDIARQTYNDAFITQASAFLTPLQLQGLRELQAEQRASIERNLLPK